MKFPWGRQRDEGRLGSELKVNVKSAMTERITRAAVCTWTDGAARQDGGNLTKTWKSLRDVPTRNFKP